MNLSPDQSAALESMLDWLKGSEPYFTLSGHAGTGKTHLLGLFAGACSSSVVFTAPTNKAAGVLQAVVGDRPCYTVHSSQGLAIADDAEREYTYKAGQGLHDEYKIMVLDEASMIGAKMFEEIERNRLAYGTRFLFVGDPLQLPPVDDAPAPIFDFPGANLTQIVRQAEDNSILRLAQNFRDMILGGAPETIQSDPAGADGVHFLPDGKFRDELTASVCLNSKTPGTHRGVAWRNLAVNEMAQRLRRALYGDHINGLVKGERIFTARPIQGQMHTDDEATVLHIDRPMKHPEYQTVEVYPVAVDAGRDKGVVEAYVPTPTGAPVLEKMLGELKGKAKSPIDWQRYHRCRKAFADFRSVHAITAHRAQGSTFEEVFVDLSDLRRCRNRGMRLRLLYVACTRARKNVYLRE